MEQTTEKVRDVVHEWRITGDPGEGYPPYNFLFRSDDIRWQGDAAELNARAQLAIMAEHGDWRDGPYLHHRTVTYGPWVRD